jgi:hypothetical protein
MVPCDNETAAVDAGAVRDHRYAPHPGTGRDIDQLRHSAAPVDVRLTMSARSISRNVRNLRRMYPHSPVVAIISSGRSLSSEYPQYSRGGSDSSTQRKSRLHTAVDELESIMHIEGYSAVVHQPKALAHGGAHPFGALDVLAKAFLPLRGSVQERHLAADKAHFLGKIRP